MKRLLVLLLLGFFGAAPVALCDAFYVRDYPERGTKALSIAASAETLSQADIVNLSGTKWKLTYVVGGENRKYDIEFKKGGAFWYSEPSDTTPNNDFWEQNGEIVKISINDGFAKYEGRFTSEDLIKGTGKNVRGQRWEFKIWRGERIENPVENLSGTKWILTDFVSDDEIEYFDTEFKEGGAFWYSEPNDTTPDNDFWEQNGEIVKISFNDGFAKYEGHFVSKDLIRGTAENAAGSWEFEMRRGKRTAFPAQH